MSVGNGTTKKSLAVGIGAVVPQNATTTPDGMETLADIANEIRARAGAWPDEMLKQYDLRLADRIEAAAKRESEVE